MEDGESLLHEIEEFNRCNEEDKPIPQNLENFIEHVARNGAYIFPWSKIRKLYLTKLKSVLNNLSPLTAQLNTTNDISLNSSSLTNVQANSSQYESNNAQLIKDRVIERMESFTSAPFTIQRISELLIKPNSHYNRTDKFLRGLEKCVMVVTTVDPHGNKIFIEDVTEMDFKLSDEAEAPVEIPSVATVQPAIPKTTPLRPSTPEPCETPDSVDESMS